MDSCKSCGSGFPLSGPFESVCPACTADLCSETSPATAAELEVSAIIAEAFTGGRGLDSMYDLLDSLHLAVSMLTQATAYGHKRLSPQLWRIEEASDRIVVAWDFAKDPYSRQVAMSQLLGARLRRWPELGMEGATVHLTRELKASSNPLASEWLQELEEATPSPPLRAMEMPDEGVSLAEAASMLGLSTFNMQRLNRDGVLASLEASMFQRSVSLDAAHGLLMKLKPLASPELPPDPITLQKATRTFLGDASVTASQLIEALGNGSLPFFRPHGAKLGEYLISRARATAAFALAAPVTRETMTIREAAAQLGIYTDAVYRVVESGALPAAHRQVGRRVQYVLQRADVNQFQSDFVFVSELSRRYGVNPTNLADKISSAGPRPTSGPSIDGGLVYVFRRQEVEALDMEAVLAQKTYKSRSGRRSVEQRELASTAGLLNSTAVCTRLNISVQQLGVLVSSGDLVEDPTSRRAGNRRYFTVATVETYERRFKDNPDLVPLSNALDALEIGALAARKTWIGSGLMPEVRDGLGNRYVSHVDLARCVALRETHAFMGEAMKRLGIERWHIGNLHKLNKLDATAFLATPAGQRLYNIERIRALLSMPPGRLGLRRN